MKHLIGPLALAIALLIPAAGRGASTELTPENWEAHIALADGVSRTRLSVGMRPDASTGYDVLWDVKALFGSGLRAWFDHPGWPQGSAYVRDIQAGAFPASWTFQVSNAKAGATVTLAWDLRYVTDGCDRVDLVLLDLASGQRIDLRRTPSYAYLNPSATSVRSFRIEAALTRSAPGPAAPVAHFARRAGPNGHVNVLWREPRLGETPVAYNVYRAEPDGRLLRINELPLYNTRLKDFDLPAGETAFTYHVHGLNLDLCEGEPSALMPLRMASSD